MAQDQNNEDYQSYIVDSIETDYEAVINQTNRRDGLYAGQPWPVRAGDKITASGSLEAYHGQTVHVTQEILLNIGSYWCQVTFSDEQYWIAKDALEVPAIDYTLADTTYLAQLQFTDTVPIYEELPYSTPLAHAKRRTIGHGYFKEDIVQVFEEGIATDHKFVHVFDRDRTLWIDKTFVATEGNPLPIFNIVNDITKLKSGRTMVSPVTIHLPNELPLNAWARIKVQGASSVKWPRRNYEIKLFKDVATQLPLWLKLYDWAETRSKFSLRADYLDPSHVRTQTALDLWRAILKTDDHYVKTVKDCDFLGTTSGYPMTLNVHGRPAGIYTLMTYLDADTVGLDPQLNGEIMLLGRQGHPEKPYLVFNESEPHLDGRDFEVMSYQSAGNRQLHDNVHRLTKFIHETNDEEFRQHIKQYFDPINVINYYLFVLAVDAYDNLAHNNVLFTYDGRLWQFTMMDLDAVFMVGTGGHDLTSEAYHRDPTFSDPSSPLWEKMKRTFAPEIKSQWQQLRETVIQADQLIEDAERHSQQLQSAQILDQQLWTSPAAWFTVAHLKAYLPKHLVEVDEWVTNLK